ncbi:glycerophosphodiester phosphodiesterase [Segetibacter koreensis]|uniref:glycerophosphodiester phosphodiesterase n=1 Tax=Segetibacter koreensis TaxID=398037 RepID=UPI0005272347|nr:glycerophosphodiester phosphodiesterase [Segetibacter koreensis]
MKNLLVLCLLFLMTGCILTKKSAQPMSFDLEGHRGCRGLMPENTIPAMLHAVDLGVSTLEMDAIITKDSQVILSHDPFFNHQITTKPDGSYVKESEEKQLKLYQMTYEEVSHFDVGMRGNPAFPQQKRIKATKPRLADVIDSVEAYVAAKKLPARFYNIETKSQVATDNINHPAPAKFVELIMQVIKDKKIEARTIIQSFDVRTLQYLHKNYPAIKTVLLVEGAGSLQEHVAKLGFTPTIYSPEYSLVNPSLIKECKQMEMKVIPWTVNEVSKMKELKEMGVDGIITDYPNLLF